MRVDNNNQLPTTITRLVETGSANKTGNIEPGNEVKGSDPDQPEKVEIKLRY